MAMMPLKDMLKDGLPLNRKERFYTGTVFPMIVCKDNFTHLNLLLSLLGVTEMPDIGADPERSNIIFFTEYNLIDAINKVEDKDKFKNIPKKQDVPDIVIFVQSTINILIVFEAKMYHSCNANSLQKQMENQEEILKCIQYHFDVDKANTYHYALLPEMLKLKLEDKCKLSCKVVTWEDIFKTYKAVCERDYFFELLRIALEEYEQLAGNSKGGQNCEKKLSGDKIYKGFKEGTINKLWIGRNGGIKGKYFKNDMSSGKWRTVDYETNSNKPEGATHENWWFSVEEFILRIDAMKPRPVQN